VVGITESWCGSEVSVQRRLGCAVGFITEGEGCRSVWGHVGSTGGLGLGKRGGGEWERRPEGALVGQGQWGGLLHIIFGVDIKILHGSTSKH
jgi:hypothetical protein